MQDVLAALVSSLHRFRGDASLSSWAYVVARNACARRRKRDARHEPLEAGGGATLEVHDPVAGPARLAERRELREALESAVATLPDSLRDVLVLRDVEGLSAQQTAEQLGLGVRAVKSRLHRARLALREILAPHVEGEGRRRRPECPDVARMFSRFIEGDLDQDACTRLEQHVAACPDCNAACSSLRAALGACMAWRGAPVPARLRGAVRSALRELVADPAPQRRRPARA